MRMTIWQMLRVLIRVRVLGIWRVLLVCAWRGRAHLPRSHHTVFRSWTWRRRSLRR